MIRNLKALGLAMVAVFAMSAIVASGASAAEFTSFNTTNSTHESGTFKGSQTTTHLFNATSESGFGQVTCETAEFNGSSTTGTETNPSVTPTYANCHVVIGGTKFPVDVRTNGCSYKFTISGGAGDVFTGTADVVCPAGKVIEVEVTTAAGGTRKCLDTIGPQTGLNNVTYENNTGASPTDLVVKTATNNVKNTTSGGLLNCGVANGEHATGSYSGSTTVKGFNTSGTQIDLTVM